MRFRKYLALFLFLTTLCILVGPATAVGSQGRWQVTTVSENIWYYPFHSIVFDKNDVPHVSYRVNYTQEMRHGWKSGATWNSERIGTSWGTFTTSIAVGPDGNPAVSYGDGIYFGNLMYATNASGSWNSTIVAHGTWADAGQFSSLAFDKRGSPHITYNDGQIYATLYYAGLNTTSGKWEFSLIDDDQPYTGDAGYSSSLKFDSNNNPHVAYISDDPWGLRYATSSDGGVNWTVTKLDEVKRRDYFSRTYTGLSLALDSRGYPHISYLNQTTNDNAPASLLYTSWNGTAWNNETVALLQKRDLWASLAIDARDIPHIAYCDRANSAVMYATRSPNGIWSSQPIPQDPANYRLVSLAMNSAGRPGIAYYDLKSLSLKYAEWVE